MEFAFNRRGLMTPPNVMDGMEEQMLAFARFPSSFASDDRRADAPEGGSVGPPAASLGALLARAEASLPEPTPAQREILAKLDDTRRRIAEGRLRVAALGQFKRGKSTLLNALMGTALLPTGVTPITAIATFIEGGKAARLRIERDASKAALEFTDAADFAGALARYVSEKHNPENREGVRRVELTLPSNAFVDSVVLVDTPGVGSTFVHNTRAAEAALADCDVGIFVVSADPPITEVETRYLDEVRRSIPKIFFVLNKVDLLEDDERAAAGGFLAEVLAAKLGPENPVRIFAVSAKRALAAKRQGDAAALAASGLAELERALAVELASEKRAIVFAAGRARATALVEQLLYHAELELKALLTPEEDLKRKIAEFEISIVGFEAERRDLADFAAVDRRRLLAEINAMTDRVWSEARAKFAAMAAAETQGDFNERRARDALGQALEPHFESAARETTEAARAQLVARLAAHQAKAAALIAQVRRTAADLMELSVRLPPPEQAFELGREPYWVAPAPSNSILDASALAVVQMLPRRMRARRLRRHIAADTERATLRNVANLDWALRQNVEDAFRRFESSLAFQLSRALDETCQAMNIALVRRSARDAEVGALVARSRRSVEALASLLDDLRRATTI
jgi:hypothetical protein